MADTSPKGVFKRPWINPAHTWKTQAELDAYMAELAEYRAEYVALHEILDEVDSEARTAFRRWRGRPRQREIRTVLERKRSRRARLDPIAYVDHVAVCTGAESWTGIIRTMICPRTMYHLSVHGPVRS